MKFHSSDVNSEILWEDVADRSLHFVAFFCLFFCFSFVALFAMSGFPSTIQGKLTAFGIFLVLFLGSIMSFFSMRLKPMIVTRKEIVYRNTHYSLDSITSVVRIYNSSKGFLGRYSRRRDLSDTYRLTLKDGKDVYVVALDGNGFENVLLDQGLHTKKQNANDVFVEDHNTFLKFPWYGKVLYVSLFLSPFALTVYLYLTGGRWDHGLFLCAISLIVAGQLLMAPWFKRHIGDSSDWMENKEQRVNEDKRKAIVNDIYHKVRKRKF